MAIPSRVHRVVAMALATTVLAGCGVLAPASPSVAPPPVLSPRGETSSTEPATDFPSDFGGWVAYSTLPGDQQDGGGDVYVVRAGEEPRLIAARGEGQSRNVCPAFAPGGTRLAYGTSGDPGAIVVVELDGEGSITDTVRLDTPELGRAPCPLWSLDGTRVAYLDRFTVVLLGLDGSMPPPAAGDPAAADFERRPSGPLLSPSGDRVAALVDCHVVVADADGSNQQVVADGCYYALGTWSADGHRILYMEDISGRDFALRATSVDEPWDTVTIVSPVPVNHARSWPGHGDVSSQATP